MPVDSVDQMVIDTLKERLGDRAEKADQDFLRRVADMGSERLGRYKTALEYYEGEKGALLTDRAKTFLQRSGLPYGENYCSTVVDALAERLAVVGVTTDLAEKDAETGEESDALGEWLWDTFDQNRGDETQATVHSESLKYGDGFVLVDFNPDRGIPRLTWNSPTLVLPFYEDGVLAYCSKVWNTTAKSPTNPSGKPIRRLNIYYPHKVEKWFSMASDSEGAQWVEWLDDGDSVWPTPWIGKDGAPLGVPVFHFRNMRTADLGQAEHWQSIPQQDLLNKQLVDLSNVMDHQGFPQRWALGVSDTSSLTTDPGVVWTSENTTAQFGQFAAADPGGLLKAVESTLIRIATRSRTPAHLVYLSGGLPSGESLKTAESGLVAKVKNRQIYFGGVWSEVFRMAAMVADTFGAPAETPPVHLPELRALSLNVRWQDPETRNEKEHLDALTVMSALGVSKETILSMIPGIDPAEEEEKKARAMPDIGEAGNNLMDLATTNPPEVLPQAGEKPAIPAKGGRFKAKQGGK